MRVLLAVAGDRVCPVLDVARQFVLVNVDGNQGMTRREVCVEASDWVEQAKRLSELAPDALICGGISSPLETMLSSAGMRVIPNTCGPVEDVLAAFLQGRLADQDFLMPGCGGGRQRLRRRYRGGTRR